MFITWTNRNTCRLQKECLYQANENPLLCPQLLIHSVDPHFRPVVSIIFSHVSVRPSVRTQFSKYRKTKETWRENNDHFWWDRGSGRGDHWWHMSCFLSFPCQFEVILFGSRHLLSRYFNAITLETITIYKTGVINDPLGQPTIPAGSDCRWIWSFVPDGQPDGRTTCVKIVITTGRDCGRSRGSIYRHVFHQWSPRPYPLSRQYRSLFSLENCFVFHDFEKLGWTDGRTTCVNTVSQMWLWAGREDQFKD